MKTISLTQGKVALVDDDDHYWLSQYKWCAHFAGCNMWYAARMIVLGKISRLSRMHVEIVGKDYDHKNGNSLDNQRSNLRKATRSQNNANRRKSHGKSSIYKGVSWESARHKWKMAIVINGCQVAYRFNTEIEAALAYDKFAREFFGEFALCNFDKSMR